MNTIKQNERVTEDIVRQFYKKDKNLIVSEQYKIKGASKNVKGNNGYIDFFIKHKKFPDLCMLIECKADVTDHDKAEEETVHYAEHIKDEFKEVFLVSASGNKDSFKCTTGMFNKTKVIYNKLTSFDKLIKEVNRDEDAECKTEEDLTKYAKGLHNYLRDNIALTEEQKPLLISALIIALTDEAFDYKNKELVDVKATLENRIENSRLVAAVKDSIYGALNEAKIPKDKQIVIMNTLAFIGVIPPIYEIETNGHTRLYNIIKGIEDHLFIKHHKYSDLDLIGKFYGEFIKYTGGDGSGLGIVLTPSHIADLMCDFAELTVDDIVYDPCTGTGRFLITAMDKMLKQANTDEKKECIKAHQLVGTEIQAKLYTMAAANMIFRGDGKANLHNGSCFNLEPIVKDYKPTVSILNPPYSQKQAGLKEMDFILHACNMTQRGGKVVAIVPKSVFIDKKNNSFKEKLLNEHTLEAVISMPNDLFYPIATHTVIVVIKVGVPNSKKHRTYFYNFSDDGHKTVIRKGRVDQNYQKAKTLLFNNFDRKEIIAGISAYKHVTWNDEWTLEAYAKTDYSTLIPKMFAKKEIDRRINDFLYNPFGEAISILTTPTLELNVEDWKEFKLTDLFDIKKGKRLIASTIKEGSMPFLSAKAENNGLNCYIDNEHHKMQVFNNCITIDGLCNIHLHNHTFVGSDEIFILVQKEKITWKALQFIQTVLKLLNNRYSYGRKITVQRLFQETIKLPVTAEDKPDWNFMEEYMICVNSKVKHI